MTNLPVITGLGGVNAAGRSSGNHSYRRIIFESLSETEKLETQLALASLMGKISKQDGQWLNESGDPVRADTYLKSIGQELLNQTLIRKLETNLFDPQKVHFHSRMTVAPDQKRGLIFDLHRKQIPGTIPPGWKIKDSHTNPDMVSVEAEDSFDILLDQFENTKVNSAGQLPTGFNPAHLYQSRNHPRTLQMTVYAASDAINSLGIEWDLVNKHVHPDQIGVYAGSAMGQLDYNGFGGLLQAKILGRKVTAKQMPLGYAEMPGDFINAYLLGNLGSNGTNVAACATFLYNLRHAVRDIQSGSHRVVIVGTSEAPIFPESIDGFVTMNALADDESLRKLDNLSVDQEIDHRRACRPFSNNTGFTLGESAQYIVLFDEKLALDLGANILGSINEVFIAADGYKKSITSPGLGNYISMAKATAATRNLIGEEGLKQRSYVQAHGTGTPQNRLTESHILSQVAKTFKVDNWPITAVKSYVGHSVSTSAGDQMVSTLGVFNHGVIPGILSINGVIADDVTRDRLDFLTEHRDTGRENLDATIINSKGFGGNNASASILAPHFTTRMLEKRYGKEALKDYYRRNEKVKEATSNYDRATSEGKNNVVYKFDNNVLGSESIAISENSISINDIDNDISLEIENKYQDMSE